MPDCTCSPPANSPPNSSRAVPTVLRSPTLEPADEEAEAVGHRRLRRRPATPPSCAPARSPCSSARTPRSPSLADALDRGGHRRPPQRIRRRFADAGGDPAGCRPRIGFAVAGLGTRHPRRAEPRRTRHRTGPGRGPISGSSNPSTNSTGASPMRCSSSSATPRSVTVRDSGRGWPPPTRSTTAPPAASRCSRSTHRRVGSGTPSCSPGVETSLVPHKSATTAVGKAEEGRLLYVAMTRATDRLVISHAQRRAGYARTPSPFLAGLATGEPEPARPPARHRRARVDPVLAALTDWRENSARRLDILPTELCTDRDLAAIAQASSDDGRGTGRASRRSVRSPPNDSPARSPR